MREEEDVGIWQGGLLRCCIASVEEFIERKIGGDEHCCKYCGNPMKKTPSGAWEWDREKCEQRTR